MLVSSLLARASTDCLCKFGIALFLWLAGCWIHRADQPGYLFLLLRLQIARYWELSPLACRSGLDHLGKQIAGFHVQSFGKSVEVVNEDSLPSGLDICQGCSRHPKAGSELRLRQFQASPPLSDNSADGLVNWLQLHAGTDHIHAQQRCQCQAQNVCITHFYLVLDTHLYRGDNKMEIRHHEFHVGRGVVTRGSACYLCAPECPSPDFPSP